MLNLSYLLWVKGKAGGLTHPEASVEFTVSGVYRRLWLRSVALRGIDWCDRLLRRGVDARQAGQRGRSILLGGLVVGRPGVGRGTGENSVQGNRWCVWLYVCSMCACALIE